MKRIVCNILIVWLILAQYSCNHISSSEAVIIENLQRTNDSLQIENKKYTDFISKLEFEIVVNFPKGDTALPEDSLFVLTTLVSVSEELNFRAVYGDFDDSTYIFTGTGDTLYSKKSGVYKGNIMEGFVVPKNIGKYKRGVMGFYDIMGKTKSIGYINSYEVKDN